MIEVIALERGYDGVAVREPGDKFMVDEKVFDKRPRLDEKGVPIKDAYYDPPRWFEPTDEALKKKIAAEYKPPKEAARVPVVPPAAVHQAQRVPQVPPVNPSKQQADQEAEHARIAEEQRKAGEHATEPPKKKP